jgi:hypothetical protein
MQTMIKSMICVGAAFISGIMMCACGSTPAPDKVITEFVKEVNSQTKDTGVEAMLSDELLVLNFKLKSTPENIGKAIMMIESDAAKEAFCKSLVKNFEEGPVLNMIVREKKTLAFCITVDELELHALYTPSELRKILKKE